MFLPFQNIVILGSGNVAFHFAKALKSSGKNVVQIYSRTKSHAEELATLLQTSHVDNLSEISPNADIYILAVSDTAILELSEKLSFPDKIVVHAAGSIPMNVMESISQNIGVIYPIQSLLKNADRDLSNVPLCLEASNEKTLNTLKLLATGLSWNVSFLNSEQRKMVHLSATFISNFGNLINTAGYEILKAADIPFDLLKPLIEENIRKTEHGNPFQFQTGPAMRGDKQVIEKQLKLLKNFPEYQKLYRTCTEIIRKKADKEGI